MSDWSGRRVLITGGNGFLGSHVVRRLVEEGAKVGLLLRPDTNRIRIADILPQVTILEATIADSAGVIEVVRKYWPEHILHMAAYGVDRDRDNLKIMADTNVSGTIHLLDAARLNNSLSLVFVSSSYVYEGGQTPRHENDTLNPTSPYAVSKAAAEQFCRCVQQQYGLRTLIVRPFLVYGPYQGCRMLIPSVAMRALRGERIKVTKGEQVRDFLYVDDFVDALLDLSLAIDQNPGVVNIGSGVGYSVRAVVEEVVHMTGKNSEVEYGGLEYRKGEVWNLVASTEKLLEYITWKPKVDLHEGLERTIAWYRESQVAQMLPGS